MNNIADNLAKIEQEIHLSLQNAHRLDKNVTLIAVSKTKPATMIEQAYTAGQRHFGENYVQEGVDKIAALQHLPDLNWHFIGPIQSNKTKAIAENFSWVHSIDREKIASRLNEQRPSSLPALNVCIQVNISNEASKSGVKIDEVEQLANFITQCKNLSLRGLMAIPQIDNQLKTGDSDFVKMQRLFNSLQSKYANFDTLSMGMSADLSDAISAGSTMVRVGTAIFGNRA